MPGSARPPPPRRPQVTSASLEPGPAENPGGVTALSQIGPITQGVKKPIGYMTSFPSEEISGSWS